MANASNGTATTTTTSTNYSTDHANYKQWEEFKVKFNRSYTNITHETERRKIFFSNLDRIESHNDKFARGLSSYEMGINGFTDMTYEEFSNVMLMKVEKAVERNLTQIDTEDRKIPNHWDWRNEGRQGRGIINPIQYQGDCGSCWAFATIGSVSAFIARKGGPLLELSEQMLIDCGPGTCSGGSVSEAFETLIHKGGDCLKKDYPYRGTSGNTCKLSTCKIAASISYYRELPLVLKYSVYVHGPLAIHVYANDAFKNYKQGIFHDESCPKDEVNHALVNIGYDIDDSYWILRNSWKDWGEEGYMRIRSGSNICNCEKYAAFPYGPIQWSTIHVNDSMEMKTNILVLFFVLSIPNVINYL